MDISNLPVFRSRFCFWSVLHSELKPSVSQSAAKTGAQTLPPIGFVDFCKRYQQECTKWFPTPGRIHLGAQDLEQVNKVNRLINAKVAPISDEVLYNTPEHWEYPTGAGDCEDYVLLKRQYLAKLGVPVALMPITVVLDETGSGHAVLTLLTDRGDLVLDNRRDDIRDWRFTGYKFLKRQSQGNPRMWVALQTQPLDSQAISNQGPVAPSFQ